MNKEKRWLKTIAATLLLILVFTAEGMAYPSVTKGDSTLKFWRDCRCTVFSSAYPGDIVTTSAGTGDPLVGSRQVVWIPSHPTQFDYRMVDEISPGVWTVSTSTTNDAVNEPLNIFIGSEWGGTPYITGTVVAETIDFNTGVLNFGAVTNLETQNEGLLNSPVLNEFSQYSTGTFSFEFATSSALASWVSNPWSSYWNTTYRTTLAAVPEPEEWALMMVGVTLLGFSIYRKQAHG